MARVIRTPVAPGSPVVHDCRDERGRKVRGTGRSGQRCQKCNTWLVYVRDDRARTTGRQR